MTSVQDKTGDEYTPKHVVIVGAGIVGVSTAIWLQRAGVKVTLVDAAGPAAGASQGNAGVLSAASVVPVTVPGLLAKVPGMLATADKPLFVRWRYLPKLMPFLFKYLKHANPADVSRIAQSLAQLLHDTADQHAALCDGLNAARYVEPGDYLFGYADRAAFEADSLGWDLRRKHNYEFEQLDASALATYDPVLGGRFGYAVRCPGHGRISDPGAYVRSLADSVVAEGGAIERASVSDIHVSDGGVRGVKTSAGDIDADGVVLAVGVWSGELARKINIKVPIEAEGGYHLEFVNPNIVPRSPTMVASGKFVMTPMDGRMRCAGVLEFAGINEKRNATALELLKKNTRALLPELEYDRIDEWMGFRPAIADSIPLIGAVGGVRNLWTGFGHHHVGLSAGPKTGRWLAGLISGSPPSDNISAFSPTRFQRR